MLPSDIDVDECPCICTHRSLRIISNLALLVGAVKIFKAAIELERIRQENDERIITLLLAMCDMMDLRPHWVRTHLNTSTSCRFSVLCSLKSLVEADIKKRDPQTGTSIESRMQNCMRAITDSIVVQCAKLCDSYQKRHLASTFTTGRPGRLYKC